MKQIPFLAILCLIHWTSAADNDVETFIQQLKDQFRPIEHGDNVTLNVNFYMRLYKKLHRVEYEFWTRNQSHGQWASKLTFERVHKPDASIIRSFVYKSLFTDGKLYLNHVDLDQKHEFAESLLIKGPQINLFIDAMRAKIGIESYNKYSGRLSAQYTKYFDSTEERYWTITQFDDGDYQNSYRDKRISLDIPNINVQVHSSLDDQLFKVTDDMKPLKIKQRLRSDLFMGLWGLIKM